MCPLIRIMLVRMPCHVSWLLPTTIVATAVNPSSHSEDRRRCSKVSFRNLFAPICPAGTQQVIPPLGQLAPMSPNSRGKELVECSRWQHPPLGTTRSLVQPPSSMNQHNLRRHSPFSTHVETYTYMIHIYIYIHWDTRRWDKDWLTKHHDYIN